MQPACGRNAALHFYLSHGLVRVCEIEFSHSSKNNGNPNLVCEKINIHNFALKKLI